MWRLQLDILTEPSEKKQWEVLVCFVTIPLIFQRFCALPATNWRGKNVKHKKSRRVEKKKLFLLFLITLFSSLYFLVCLRNVCVVTWIFFLTLSLSHWSHLFVSIINISSSGRHHTQPESYRQFREMWANCVNIDILSTYARTVKASHPCTYEWTTSQHCDDVIAVERWRNVCSCRTLLSASKLNNFSSLSFVFFSSSLLEMKLRGVFPF